jgi:predicted membrane chloride channel (bestrophin family)
MMTCKEMLREGWDATKDLVRSTAGVARVSWREAFKLFRKSVVPAILERIVGLFIFGLVCAFLVVLFKIWYGLMRISK